MNKVEFKEIAENEFNELSAILGNLEKEDIDASEIAEMRDFLGELENEIGAF